MKFLMMVSLRNLFRQKRRNILLGSAMAFGVMILIIANSFSHGISDIMFNKIVSYVAGHVNVSVSEGRGRGLPIFRDKARLEEVIKKNAGDSLEDFDEGIGIFLRALGNGKSENMVLVGINTRKTITEKQRKEYEESFYMIEGKFEDLSMKSVENPMILSKEKAAALNVRKNDIVRIRFKNIYGQTQSARLTVSGILSNDNIFMQGVMFVELTNLKEMMGYREYECGNINLTLKNPEKNASAVADRIHKAFRFNPAFIYGDINAGGKGVKGTIIPFMGNDDSKKDIVRSSFKLYKGKMDDVLSKEGVMISKSLADRIGARVGQKIEVRFKQKFDEEEAKFSATVKGVFVPDRFTGADTIYMHEALFYPHFYENLPDLSADMKKAFFPAPDAKFKNALGTEWVLLERSHSTDDLKKKLREAAKKKIRAGTVDVNSMYESASDVLKLEGVLNLITIGAVLVLFFIILIGVVNTLRMTIRERTREIGTIRAIGMQKRDVRRIFILETAFLTLFASVAGAIIAFAVMGLLSLIPFNLTDNPMGILLVKQHLYFLPTFQGVIGNIILIVMISVVTAYFPARRAAHMSAADALRHFE